MTEFMTMENRARLDALRYAKEITERTGRKHVVREDFGRFYVVPQYERRYENYHHDAGYAALGVLVKESP